MNVLVIVLNGERDRNATFRVITVNSTAVGMEHSISSNVIILMVQDIQHLLLETTKVLRWSLCLVQPLHSTSNKNFILKYFRCRDGKRTETRIGMEGICITHSCIPLYTVYMQHIMAHSGGMQEWVIQIPSIPILVSVLFPSLHLKYFRIKFLLLVCIVFMRMRTKPHLHPVIS